MIDGIPCIVLEDEDEWEEARRKHRAAYSNKPDFTDFMQEKHRKYYNQIKKELKDKFGEK
jgi:hypothetical protein